MNIAKSEECVELMLPFELVQEEGDYENGGITIKVYGNVLGENKSFVLTYVLSKGKMYKNNDYNEILTHLKSNENKKVKVIFKIVNGKIKKIKIDLASLTSLYYDNRFNEFELLGWGEISLLDENNMFDNKIVLGPEKKGLKIINTLISILMIFLILPLNILIIISNTMVGIIILLITLLLAFLLKYVANSKIEIENSIISKTNLFNKKKVIGYASEIESFSVNKNRINVLKSKEKLFHFRLNGNHDNCCLYNYLKNNYPHSTYIVGGEIESFIYLFFSIFYILLGISYTFMFLLIGIFLLYKGLDEVFKLFQIVDNKIIYKRLFVNKIINLSDLTIIRYKKRTYYRSYYSIRYTIMGFNKTSELFKVDHLIKEEFETIKKNLKKYNVKMIEK